MQNYPRFLNARFSTDGRSQRGRLISLTPLIDVVFILLIFFMMATNLLEWRAIPLSTAVGKQAPATGAPAILVRIKRDAQPVLNGVPVSDDELGRQVQRLMGSRPQLRVLVQPDSGVPLQQTVAVVDILAGAGARNVVLVRR